MEKENKLLFKEGRRGGGGNGGGGNGGGDEPDQNCGECGANVGTGQQHRDWCSKRRAD